MTPQIHAPDSEGGSAISLWLFTFLRVTRRPYDYRLGEWWSFS